MVHSVHLKCRMLWKRFCQIRCTSDDNSVCLCSVLTMPAEFFSDTSVLFYNVWLELFTWNVHCISSWWQYLELCMGSTQWERWYRKYCHWVCWWHCAHMEVVSFCFLFNDHCDAMHLSVMASHGVVGCAECSCYWDLLLTVIWSVSQYEVNDPVDDVLECT